MSSSVGAHTNLCPSELLSGSLVCKPHEISENGTHMFAISLHGR